MDPRGPAAMCRYIACFCIAGVTGPTKASGTFESYRQPPYRDPIFERPCAVALDRQAITFGVMQLAVMPIARPAGFGALPGMTTTPGLTGFSADQLRQLATTLMARVEQQDQVLPKRAAQPATEP